jgi:D,D-heptose 1,7-bisphosphate phosphatase
VLDYWIDCMMEAGLHQARINTHALADQVRAYIRNVNASVSFELVESYEPVLLGSAGTVTANVDLADTSDHIVIIYADNISDVDLRPLLAFHRAHGDPFTMVLFHAPDPRSCGIAQLDAEGRVLSFVEKPEWPSSDLANAGIYVVDAEAYRQIAELGAFDLGFDVLPLFVGRMRGWVWGGYHRDIGNLQSLELARQDVVQAFPKCRLGDRSGLRPAVFLDRDGTLIRHVHYLSDPAHVQLLPGAAQTVARLRRAGYACVLVTNQSVIGRGIITEARLHEIHMEMNRQLAEQGAVLDGIYYCPEVPAGKDRTAIESPDRKPGPGMLRRAAADLNLVLAKSWMVGDMISDVLAGINAGCRSILVASDKPILADVTSLPASGRYSTAPDLAAAADQILTAMGSEG